MEMPVERTRLRFFNPGSVMKKDETVKFLAHEEPMMPVKATAIWLVGLFLYALLSSITIPAPSQSDQTAGTVTSAATTTAPTTTTTMLGDRRLADPEWSDYLPAKKSWSDYLPAEESSRSFRGRDFGGLKAIWYKLPDILAVITIVAVSLFWLAQMVVWLSGIYLVTNQRVYHRRLVLFPNWHWPGFELSQLDPIPFRRPQPGPAAPGANYGRTPDKRQWDQVRSIWLEDIRNMTTDSHIAIRMIPKRWRWGSIGLVASGDIPEIEANVPYYLYAAELIESLRSDLPNPQDRLDQIANGTQRLVDLQGETLDLLRSAAGRPRSIGPSDH